MGDQRCVVARRVGIEQVAIPEDLRPDGQVVRDHRWRSARTIWATRVVPGSRRAPLRGCTFCGERRMWGSSFPLRAAYLMALCLGWSQGAGLGEFRVGALIVGAGGHCAAFFRVREP